MGTTANKALVHPQLYGTGLADHRRNRRARWLARATKRRRKRRSDQCRGAKRQAGQNWLGASRGRGGTRERER
eukprot:5746651-Alexandrium_andersonii.AAC.1